VRRRILDRLNEAEGHKPYALLEARHIKARRNEMRDRPEAANSMVKALRQVFAFAVDDDEINAARNPAKEVSYVRTITDGYHDAKAEAATKVSSGAASTTCRHLVNTRAVALSLCNKSTRLRKYAIRSTPSGGQNATVGAGCNDICL
jgi:hypothetical protein